MEENENKVVDTQEKQLDEANPVSDPKAKRWIVRAVVIGLFLLLALGALLFSYGVASSIMANIAQKAQEASSSANTAATTSSSAAGQIVGGVAIALAEGIVLAICFAIAIGAAIDSLICLAFSIRHYTVVRKYKDWRRVLFLVYIIVASIFIVLAIVGFFVIRRGA